MTRFVFAILFLPLVLTLSGQQFNGFFDFNYLDDKGKIEVIIPDTKIDKPFLYISSLSEGIGSNDIGLDRGQLGKTRVVQFQKAGNKLLLVQDNLKYRAISDNPDEVNAVKEAFAQAVIWGFVIKDKSAKGYKIDITDFLLHDRHLVSEKLATKKQGSFKLDKSKSAIQLENTYSFPKNSEFEAILTFVGVPEGKWLKEVAIDDHIISVGQHHSFVELPDDDYQERIFLPSSGYFPIMFEDYATPIGMDMTKRLITRHRLVKKNPAAAMSEVEEPIIYYLDSGCPEPVKSALIEGASWWEEAFEAAGYKNAFRVEVMPAGANPLDIRYNVIQWVHRKTRGWSYGASVTDPRTGEIIKGHVSLGSLRVRQDYMIAQGILSTLEENPNDPTMLEMALARLRQLSAHEVGHTLGLTHNFSASTENRSSVMDYPHPLIHMKANSSTDFSNAYAVGIGEWDKRAIIYGYSSLPQSGDDKKYLQSIIDETERLGYSFITDGDARPAAGLHPDAHLWDNGSNPVDELDRLIALRRVVLNKMGKGSLKEGEPYSSLENILVPAYLMHRYQVEAVSKIVGGMQYDYSLKKISTDPELKFVDVKNQQTATQSLLRTLNKDFLEIPSDLMSLIPPPAFGYKRNRESFKGHTGLQFDPIAAAEASANHTLTFLLNPERLTRIMRHDQANWNLGNYFKMINEVVFSKHKNPYNMMVEKLLYIHLLKLSQNTSIDMQLQASIKSQLALISREYLVLKKTNKESDYQSHIQYLRGLDSPYRSNGEAIKLPAMAKVPPGSPIGCGGGH